MSSNTESRPCAETPDYLPDLWLRLGLDEQDKDRPLEEWASQIARREIENISAPLFVSKARTFVEEKLKTKLEWQDFSRLIFFLTCLLKSPVAPDARILLIELFKRPKMTMQLRIALTEAATEAKVVGMTEYILPLLSNRNNGYKAAQYLTACPDPASIDALGQFFLENPQTIWGGGGFTLNAMLANISPGLLKYVVPVLEKEREGKSDAVVDPRMIALSVIGKVGDKSLTPLVMKELQNYSDRPTMRGCLFALADLADEQAYDLFVNSLSQYIKKYFEKSKNETSSDEDFFLFTWAYFQKLGRDKTSDVVALLHRLVVPQVWQRIGDQDRRFFREQYKDFVGFPELNG